MPIDPLVGALLIFLADWLGSRAMLFVPIPTVQVDSKVPGATAPRNPDGLIDYEAAYHLRASMSVTPANNAAVLFEQTIGLNDFPDNLKPRFYGYLGVEPTSRADGRFSSQADYARQLIDTKFLKPEGVEEFRGQIAKASEAPWTELQYPLVAYWIQANRQALELLDAASRRERLYIPLVTEKTLEDALVPFAREFGHEVRPLLRARAMLQLEKGNFEAAASDLLMCQRLAALFGQNQPGICNLVAVATQASLKVNYAYLLSQSLNPGQAARYRKEFDAIPSVTGLEFSLDVHERYMALDSTQHVWLERATVVPWYSKYRRSWIDISRAMQRSNELADELVNVHRTIGFVNRRKASAAWLEEVQQRVARARVRPNLLPLLWDSRAVASRAFGDFTTALIAPALVKLEEMEARNNMDRTLISLGFGLAAYRSVKGQYPDKLEMLVPEFCSQLPVDFFNDQPLIYRKTQFGYILYSVGQNLIDDGGKPFQPDGGGDLLFAAEDASLRNALREDPILRDIARGVAERQRQERQLLLMWLAPVAFVLSVWTIWRVVVLFYRPRLQRNPQTTFVTGPKKPDGRIDYEGAIHLQAAEEITPETNAAVVLGNAFSPPALSSGELARYFNYLGISGPESPRTPLVDERTLLPSDAQSPQNNSGCTESTIEEMSQGLVRPWTETELPLVAQWIRVNQEPLREIEQASLRLRLYIPIVGDSPLCLVSTQMVQPLNCAVRLLISRAMWHIGEGRNDDAIHDLLICHRLIGLLQHSSDVDLIFLGTVSDLAAVHCSQFLLARALSLPQIRRYQAGLAAIPVCDSLPAKLVNGLRLRFLDGVQAAASNRRIQKQLLKQRWICRVDANTVMPHINAFFDSLSSSLQPRPEHVNKRLKQLQFEMHDQAEDSKGMLASLFHLGLASRVMLNRAMADRMLQEMLPDLDQLLSSLNKGVVRRRLLSTALAITSYRATHGRFPADLQALSASDFDEAPHGHVVDGSITYWQSEDAYSLTTVAGADTETPTYEVRCLPQQT